MITKIDPGRLPEQPLRVAAYARVSTNSDEQLVSLDAQKTYYEKNIRSNPKWEYAGLYYDEGVTGTKKDKRSGLLRMLQDCRKGKIDRVIVKSISRLARNTVDTLETVRELADLGITIYFEKEDIDTGSMNGELMLSILSGLAQSESVSISANEKWSAQKRFEQGIVASWTLRSQTYFFCLSCLKKCLISWRLLSTRAFHSAFFSARSFARASFAIFRSSACAFSTSSATSAASCRMISTLKGSNERSNRISSSS